MKKSKTIFDGFVLLSAGFACIFALAILAKQKVVISDDFDSALGLAVSLFLAAQFKLIQWLLGRRSATLSESSGK